MTCSHPHSDHRRGIAAMLKNPDLFVRGDKLCFESVTIIEHGMVKSLMSILAMTKSKLPLVLRAGFRPGAVCVVAAVCSAARIALATQGSPRRVTSFDLQCGHDVSAGPTRLSEIRRS